MPILRKGKFGNNLSADEMFLDDSFQHGRRTRVIPNRFRINDRDGAMDANTQAIGFRAIDQRFSLGEIQFFQSLFQEFPRLQAGLLCAAFGFGLVRA